MGTSSKIHFGVIGQGHIGKRHAEMIRRNPDCELIAVCDILPREKTGNDAAKEPYFLSASDMLAAHPELDVICVCTPNGLHAEYALLALNSDRHIICEKPMTLSTADCLQLIEASKNRNKKIFCVMQNRYSPPAVWLKEITEKKVIGEVFMVQLNCYWNRDERYYKKGHWKGSQKQDGGTLFTQFSHFIDILYWLFGDITEIQGKFSDFTHATLTEFEDSGFINFKFLNGGMGSINYSTAVWDSNLESSLTIVGSKGSVKVGGQYMDKVEFCHIQNYTLPELPPTRPANDYGTYKGSANNHHLVIKNVVANLLNQTPIAATAEEGLAVVNIIERIYSLRNKNRKS